MARHQKMRWRNSETGGGEDLNFLRRSLPRLGDSVETGSSASLRKPVREQHPPFSGQKGSGGVDERRWHIEVQRYCSSNK